MTRYYLISLIALFISQKLSCANEEYYWLDYNGSIPDKAIVGGYDNNGEDIYIGAAELENVGTLVAPIFPEVPYIKIPSENDVVQINSSIKILCGEEPPVSWIRANSENLHVNLIGKNPVIGGTIKAKTDGGNVYIGRISFDNEIKIGTIMAFRINEASLYFIQKDKVLSTHMYEVLTYNLPRERRRGRPRHRGPHRRGH